MENILYSEINEFNEIIVTQDFIKIKKNNDTQIYYFNTINFNKSFNTSLIDNYVEVSIYIDNQEILFMINKIKFLKFKEVINPIRRNFENTDFTLNISNKEQKYNPTEDDDESPIYAIIGFLIPIIGFIIWCILVNTKPKTAKLAGISSIIGFIFNIIIYFVWLSNLTF